MRKCPNSNKPLVEPVLVRTPDSVRMMFKFCCKEHCQLTFLEMDLTPEGATRFGADLIRVSNLTPAEVYQASQVSVVSHPKPDEPADAWKLTPKREKPSLQLIRGGKS